MNYILKLYHFKCYPNVYNINIAFHNGDQSRCGTLKSIKAALLVEKVVLFHPLKQPQATIPLKTKTK